MKDTIKILSKPYYVKCIKEVEGVFGFDKSGKVIKIIIHPGENLVAFKSLKSKISKVITFIDNQYNLFFVSPSSHLTTLRYFIIENPLTYSKKDMIEFVENKKYELI